jgi:hypothetical protein
MFNELFYELVFFLTQELGLAFFALENEGVGTGVIPNSISLN